VGGGAAAVVSARVVSARVAARALAVGALAWAAAVLTASAAAAHPLHTTVSQLSYDGERRELRVEMRAFADDLAAAVARRARTGVAGGAPSDAATLAYLSDSFVLIDPSGRPVPLGWCGARRAGDALLICMRGPVRGAGLRGYRLRNVVLFDSFADQVNVVRASAGRSTQTLLFTAGADTRTLR
jgi:hypothetical protein